MIKVKDGYAKLVGTTASGSASHILLSNGGVKAVSDFAMADGTNATGTWSIDISGNAKSSTLSLYLLTGVGSEYNANTLAFSDHLLRWYSSVPSTSSNIPTSTGWLNGILALPLHSNGITAQLYFSYSKALFYRSSASGDWKQIAFTDLIPTVTNYYWANVKVSDTSNTATKPTFSNTIVNGVLTVNGGIKTLAINHNHTLSTAWNDFIACLNPNLTATYHTAHITFGCTYDSKNVGYIGFKYAGSASNNNMVTIGLHSVDNILNILASGNVGIGTISPSYKLHVEGDIYATSTNAAISINRTGTYSSEPCIGYYNAGTRLGSIGVKDYNTPFFWNASTSTVYTIWHSGNDGSGSGLDADLLDGKHLSSFITYELATDYVGASFNSEDLSKKAASTYIEYWDGTGGWFNSRWGLVLAISGFHRVGSSDSYVLLGGGGHKLESSLSVNYATSAGSSGSSGSLYTGSIGSSGDSHASALQNYFNSYKTSIPRNSTISLYSSAYSNGSQYMGYFLGGYNDTPYGGFFVAHYNNPYYVGISYGAYSEQLIITSASIGSQSVNYANSAGYATNARYVIADNNAKSPGYALLQSGSGRADSSPGGDTWIYWDTLGGTASPWGILHEQYSNYISFYGAGNRRSFINLSDGCVYGAHFYENSDIRYKTIINNVAIKANQLANLPLFDFKWLDNENLLNTGTSAQAVQELLPYIVSGNNKLTLDYGVLGTIAGITACKELTEQEKEINKLKEQIKFLKDEINNLKTNKLWQS